MHALDPLELDLGTVAEREVVVALDEARTSPDERIWPPVAADAMRAARFTPVP